MFLLLIEKYRRQTISKHTFKDQKISPTVQIPHTHTPKVEADQGCRFRHLDTFLPHLVTGRRLWRSLSGIPQFVSCLGPPSIPCIKSSPAHCIHQFSFKLEP